MIYCPYCLDRREVTIYWAEPEPVHVCEDCHGGFSYLGAWLAYWENHSFLRTRRFFEKTGYIKRGFPDFYGEEAY